MRAGMNELVKEGNTTMIILVGRGCQERRAGGRSHTEEGSTPLTCLPHGAQRRRQPKSCGQRKALLWCPLSVYIVQAHLGASLEVPTISQWSQCYSGLVLAQTAGTKTLPRPHWGLAHAHEEAHTPSPEGLPHTG